MIACMVILILPYGGFVVSGLEVPLISGITSLRCTACVLYLEVPELVVRFQNA